MCGTARHKTQRGWHTPSRLLLVPQHTIWRSKAARSLSGVISGTLALISLSTSTDLLAGLGTARLLCRSHDQGPLHSLGQDCHLNITYRDFGEAFLPAAVPSAFLLAFFAGVAAGMELVEEDRFS